MKPVPSICVLLFLLLAPPARAEVRVHRGEDGRVVASNTVGGAYGRPAVGREERAPRALSVSAAPADLKGFIRQSARRYGVSPDLVHAVVAVESGYDPRAVSPKGARGLMQLMPDTARALGVTDVYDPRLNLDGGVRHLRSLLDSFEGNLTLALAAYNAGAEAVRRYDGVPPFPETEGYVQKVLERLDRSGEWAAMGGAPELVGYRNARGTLVMSNVPTATASGPVRVAIVP